METSATSTPDLYVIGAMKGGTSTFWKGAFDDKALCPSKSKEVNFMIADHSPAELEKLYRKQFSNRDRIKIDVSPNYSRRHLYPDVAKRISAINSRAKILYMVRNPIDRIVSHLQHDMFRDRISSKDIGSSLFENEDYIKTGSYFFQIEDYLKYFDKSQILVLEMERMKSDPDGFCAAVASFLNLSGFKLPSKGYNLSEKRYLIKYHDQVHRYFPAVGKLYHYLWYVLNVKVERPNLSDEHRAKLTEILRPDSARLASEFKIDTSDWF